MVILWCHLYNESRGRDLKKVRILRINAICRLSSVVEHAHGKGGVMSSNLIVGSIFVVMGWRPFRILWGTANVWVLGEIIKKPWRERIQTKALCLYYITLFVRFRYKMKPALSLSSRRPERTLFGLASSTSIIAWV